MKIFITFSVGLALIGTIAGCKPQSVGLVSAQAAQDEIFVPLPASTEKPIKTSISALARFKSVGDLTVPFYNDQPFRLTFSPDGRWGAAPSRTYNGDVLLWNLRTRVLTKRLKASQFPHRAFANLAWSPDSKKIVAWNDAASPPDPLLVWDVASEEVQDSTKHGEFTVTSACFLTNGRLLVSWFNNTDPLANESRVSIKQDSQQKDLDVGNHTIQGLFPRRNKPPLALILTPTGQKAGVDPIFETSVCEWEDDHLGEPIIKFGAREAMLTMVLSANEKALGLSGIEQPKTDQTAPIGLYAMCDLETPKILWRSEPKDIGWSPELSLSPNGKQFWTLGAPPYPRYLVFNARGGRFIQGAGEIPYFSPDGQRAVQLVTQNRGQKPFLATFHLFEKR